WTVGRRRLARPLHGRKRDGDRARGADQVREEPRHPVEAAIEWRTEHLFRAVLRQKRLDDLVVVLALVDERGELAAHLVRRAAVVLAALREVLMPARAARADDLVLHLFLEGRPRVERRSRIDCAAHALLRRRS